MIKSMQSIRLGFFSSTFFCDDQGDFYIKLMFFKGCTEENLSQSEMPVVLERAVEQIKKKKRNKKLPKPDKF